MSKFLFTSESVTEGHPDKLCDQVSDAVLDAMLTQDNMSRVACETAATTGMVIVMGEITTESYVDIPSVVRKVVKDIGYTGGDYGFNAESCAVVTSIDEQSPDIALGVDKALESKEGSSSSADEIGAGDQGMMFGYACDETDILMPAPAFYANELSKQLTAVRKQGVLQYLRPDGKSQVTVEYVDGTPRRIDCVVISSQHAADVSLSTLKEGIMEEVVKKTLPKELLDANTKYYINPTGRFVVGGPQGDSGLTGRKIIVDTYGGMARHGGGAFSGKDPTKVDRSAAYAARYVAKNIVAAGLAKRCELQLAYAIGVAKPVSVMVDTFGTGTVDDDRLSAIVEQVFDLRPAAIIDALDLRRPIYRPLAAYGHFGRRELDLPWEKTDKVDAIKALI